jgi:hypothetical protein
MIKIGKTKKVEIWVEITNKVEALPIALDHGVPWELVRGVNVFFDFLTQHMYSYVSKCEI